jgi:rubrerythrin
MKFKSAEEILDFAIEKEEEAAQFYMDLADRMSPANMKEVFQEFAKEEEGHKKKLLLIRSGEKLFSSHYEILDLKIGDNLTEIDTTTVSSELSYQQALIIAMKAEKAAFRLYNDLAKNTNDKEIRDLLLSLAKEEAKHKLRFEIEYDDNIFIED